MKEQTPPAGSRDRSGRPEARSEARVSIPRPSPRAKKVTGAERTGPNTAPTAARSPDAVDLLVDDHLAVHACFKRYDKLVDEQADASEREALAGVICEMLTAHTVIEEEIFYPAARAAGIEADLLDEAEVEHASAKALIAEIEAGSGDDELYDAKVKVLGEYINHHVVEEHTEMFPKCRKAELDLAELRMQMEARKAELAPPGP